MEGFAWLIVIGIALWFVAQVRRGYRGDDQREQPRRGSRVASGTYAVQVVGESQYQGALERICGGVSRDGAEKYVTATLVPEDSNPYDENAVRVDVAGATVGYLSRHAAKVYRKRLASGAVSRECPALIRGGWDRGRGDRGSFGVRLDLP